MFVGTGAGGGVLEVCPSDGEIVRGAVDVPVAAPVDAVVDVPAGVGAVEGKRPQSDGEGAGAGSSISIVSSGAFADAAVDALGAAAVDATALGTADATGARDTAGETGGETRPN
jgi:hypothetical protein